MASLSRTVWRVKGQPASIAPLPRCVLGRAISTSWHAQTSHPSSRVQVYTSHSHDPYLNLSAEHFLLQNSHPESAVLFLYTNDPCVVIGRNQNPWLEVNLGLLRGFRARTGVARHDKDDDHDDHDDHDHHDDGGGGGREAPVSLVRRRSGGGAVFHDAGNVNFSVICPPAAFDRNRHAEMVVRALRSLGAPTARVNERHDIVLDRHGGQGEAGAAPPALKISGSAYKLTRLRSLHHGTCLLRSPNLAGIGRLLRSPAAPFVKARGVESVRSRICNVGVPVGDFVDAVRREFGAMYGAPDVDEGLGGGHDGAHLAHEAIQKGCRELMSRDWIYNQTPLFTFSTHPSEEDPRQRPPIPPDLPEGFRATITARHGQIQEANLSGFDGSALQGQQLHTVTDWRKILSPGGSDASQQVGKWLNHLFGIGDTK